MINYPNCATYHSGLHKPNTIYINGRGISIIYGDKENYIKNMDFYATASDHCGNIYDIYTEDCKTYIGILAFPRDPDKIKGFYPWL